MKRETHPAEIQMLERALEAARKRYAPKCAAGDCDSPGIVLAAWRGNEEYSPPFHYCRVHADEFADKDGREYTACCPACTCEFGVG